MIIHGVDTSEALPFSGNTVAGRVLIMDGDGPCYRIAAVVKRLDTAIRQFQQEVLKLMFMTNSTTARVHLTARDSDKYGRFRVIAEKPYQGQRKSKEKPPLLEPLRIAMSDESNWLEDFDVILHRDIEADDGMMQDAYRLKEDGVVWSEDKDLRMTPYPYFEVSRGQVMPSQPIGWISLKYTDAGQPKIVGQGPLFFWAQMLCGDTADNVKGLSKYNGGLCGPVKAYEVLEDVKCIHQAANIVLDAYRKINQNVVAEGWLLWLTRYHKDNVIEYMNSLDLSALNSQFMTECSLREWVKSKEAHERDTNI